MGGSGSDGAGLVDDGASGRNGEGRADASALPSNDVLGPYLGNTVPQARSARLLGLQSLVDQALV